MTENKNKVIVKISGQKAHVLKAVKQIETLFPLYLESKVHPNKGADGIAAEGVHVFLNIAVPNEEGQ